jgi:hypothetical protein
MTDLEELFLKQTNVTASPPLLIGERLYAELWTSLASLLRSYAALHGLHSNRVTIIDESERRITLRHHEKLLILTRSHAIVTWTRENRERGTLELTEAGTLRGPSSEEPMDLFVEQWVRELMHE